jgi:hypothetical protein
MKATNADGIDAIEDRAHAKAMAEGKPAVRYLVYRHGANGANQGGEMKRPVALVRAPSAAAACETVERSPGTLYATSELVLARGIHAYHNQSFSAVAVSRAPRADVRRVEQDDALLAAMRGR